MDSAVGVVSSLDGEHCRESCVDEGDMITVERIVGGFDAELCVCRRSLVKTIDDPLRQGRTFQ
jgi:hypothetical protein